MPISYFNYFKKNIINFIRLIKIFFLNTLPLKQALRLKSKFALNPPDPKDDSTQNFQNKITRLREVCNIPGKPRFALTRQEDHDFAVKEYAKKRGR